MTLPPKHKNGNVLDNDGKALRYADRPSEETAAIIADLKEKGVDYFSMGFDFPPVATIPLHEVTLLTILRDPLERAISNFRYAKMKGRIKPEVNFRRYLNREFTIKGPLSRSQNYYVREFSSSPVMKELGRDDLQTAADTLKQFSKVLVIGRDNLETELTEIGFTKIVTANTATRNAAQSTVELDQLEVTAEDRAWFVERNTLDVELFAAISNADVHVP